MICCCCSGDRKVHIIPLLSLYSMPSTCNSLILLPTVFLLIPIFSARARAVRYPSGARSILLATSCLVLKAASPISLFMLFCSVSTCSPDRCVIFSVFIFLSLSCTIQRQILAVVFQTIPLHNYFHLAYTEPQKVYL